jgi:hypothetical protein
MVRSELMIVPILEEHAFIEWLYYYLSFLLAAIAVLFDDYSSARQYA